MTRSTPATEETGKLVLQPDEAESRHMPGLELHQHVDVAIGTEIVPKDGAEESEPGCDSPTELGELYFRDAGLHKS